jgi:hypothetical protein
MNQPISISMWMWHRLVRTLRARGEQRRESGAFLLAPQGDRRVCEFISYDDLDPNAFDTGEIHIEGSAFVKLWRHCEATHRQVIADVHTHPDEWVGQSGSDKYYPTVPVDGHVALIMPAYATKTGLSLDGIGIYRCGGDGKWRRQAADGELFRITFL